MIFAYSVDQIYLAYNFAIYVQSNIFWKLGTNTHSNRSKYFVHKLNVKDVINTCLFSLSVLILEINKTCAMHD